MFFLQSWHRFITAHGLRANVMKPFESAQDRSVGRPSDDSTIDVPQVATFEGTFAATARPKSQTPRPWYRDRAYLLEGWLDIPIWKSAVRPGFLRTLPIPDTGNPTIGAILLTYISSLRQLAPPVWYLCRDKLPPRSSITISCSSALILAYPMSSYSPPSSMLRRL